MKRHHSQKLKARHAATQTDDWLMTYADMITLLLCFFAVFLSVNITKTAPSPRLQTPTVTSGFGAPENIEQNIPLKAKPHIVVPTSEQIGDRITSLQMSASAFFDNGSATLTPEGTAFLLQEAKILQAPRYAGYIVTVEGHTDNTPVTSGAFTSNWELSTARAAAVVHFLLDHGIEPHRLRAAGYADTFPRVPNNDAHGNPIPENQAKNRRVVIKLEKVERAD